MSDIRRDQYGSDADVLSARLVAASRVAPKSPTEALAARVGAAAAEALAGGPPSAGGLPQFRADHRHHRRRRARRRPADRQDPVRQAGQPRPGADDHRRQGRRASATSPTACRREGVVSSKWLFIAGVWLSREGNNLKAGEYSIPAHASMRDDHGPDGRGQERRLSHHHSRRPDQRAGGRLPHRRQRARRRGHSRADRRPGSEVPRIRRARWSARRRRFRRRARSCPRPTPSAAATRAPTSST